MISATSTDDSYRIRPPSSSDGPMPPSYELGADHGVPEAAIDQFEVDGALCLRNVMDSETIDALRDEADYAVAHPSPEARAIKTMK